MKTESETASIRSPRPDAERMRRYRQRRRRREHSIRVEIGRADVETLISKGYLDPANRENLKAVEEAAGMFIADAFFEVRHA